MTSDSDNSGIPSGNNNNTLDSENGVMNANMVRLLSICEISPIDRKLMANECRVLPLRDFYCYMNTQEGNREGSERDKLFKNETTRKTFKSFTPYAVKPDDETSIMHSIRADAQMTAVV